MYSIFLGLTLLQQFRPYFRKYISNSLDSHEYFFLNTMIIFFVISLYIVYLLTTKQTTFSKLVSNIYSLTYTEVFFILLMAVLTVFSGILVFHLDKNYNTPLINNVFLKSISTIALLCIGMFVFNEKYHAHQILGIFLIISGIFLTVYK